MDATSTDLEPITAYKFGIKDVVFGGLIAGSWLNSILYGVSICAMVVYWRTFKKDESWIRCLVIFTGLIDLISTLNQYIMVYDYAVVHWGVSEFLNTQPKTFFVYLVTTGTSAVVMQGYLMVRIWKLSRSFILTGFLALVSLVGYGGCWACAILIQWIFTTLDTRPKIVSIVIVWLSVSAAADIFIALALCVLLHRMRPSMKSSRQLVRRLTFASIETGCCTATWALIALAVFVAQPTSNIDVGIAYVLGRLYSLTLLFNLIYRKPLAEFAKAHPAETITFGTSKPAKWYNIGSGSDGQTGKEKDAEAARGATSGIVVQQQSEIHVDYQNPDDKTYYEADPVDAMPV